MPRFARQNRSHVEKGRRSEAGLTLLELLVVIVILGLLAVVGSVQVVKYLGRAKTDTVKLQLGQISTALDLFRIDVGRLPTTDESLRVLVEREPNIKSWGGPYLRTKAAITDPWGRVIQYRQPGEHGEYDLYSLGSDGREGGTEEAQDVANW